MSLDGHLEVTIERGAVEFAFSVTNASTEPVELEFRDGMIADFAVSEDGEEVWRWSDGRMVTQAIQTETLAPGESFTRSGTWEHPSPGEYTVVATLEATNWDLRNAVAFAV